MEVSAMTKKIRIGALISGGGTNLQAIVDACNQGHIAGELVFVGSDNPDAGGLERAREHAIPTFVVDYASIIKQFKQAPEKAVLPNDFDLADSLVKQSLISCKADKAQIKTFLMSRAIVERKLLEELKPYPFDLLVLAGFMRNLTPYFIDRINAVPGESRIMNIHPALLPAFPGVDGYGDTFRYGCKIGGCTVHFIDYGEDSGPIISQKAFEISEADSLETIRKKGLKLEWELYPQCINLFAQGRLKKVKRSYISDDGKTVSRTVVRIL